MTKFGRWAGALMVAAVAGTALLASTGADAAIVKTKISLADFKAAYNLYSVRTLSDPKADGVSFWMVKRDKNGNKIDWSSPSHAKVDESKSFIVFKSNSKVFQNILSLMKAKVQFKPKSIIAEITCNLSGDTSVGVRGVRCGGGTTVSPS